MSIAVKNPAKSHHLKFLVRLHTTMRLRARERGNRMKNYPLAYVAFERDEGSEFSASIIQANLKA